MVTRWGILGPGRIARAFAQDLRLVPDAELTAVGSRSHARATPSRGSTAFAAAYGSYAELLADESVDAVYVASPHALHVEHVTAALEAGKHVLCEKPLTLRAADAEELCALALRNERLLMEAMWTACHPVVLAVLRGLGDGAFGTPRHLHAELGFVVDLPPEDRLLDLALGAGALLDMGIYPLTVAHLLPRRGRGADRHRGRCPTPAIDLDIAVAGRYPGGALATMTASLTSWAVHRAELATDRGRLVLEDFLHPRAATFTPRHGSGTERRRARSPCGSRGASRCSAWAMAHEAVEFQRCLAEGLLESPLVPHAQTLTIMRQMDDLRRQVGVRYPGD